MRISRQSPLVTLGTAKMSQARDLIVSMARAPTQSGSIRVVVRCERGLKWAEQKVAREEANSGRFKLSGEVGDDQDFEHQKPQPLNEAAEVITDGGQHGVDGIAA